MKRISIAIIGAGNLGSRLVQLFAEHYELVEKVIVIGRSVEKVADVAAKFPNTVQLLAPNDVIDRPVEFLFLCSKPKDFREAAQTVRTALSRQTKEVPICSTLAGVSLKQIEQEFPQTKDILRAMPNLALSYKKSVTGYVHTEQTSRVTQVLFETLFSPGGFTLRLENEDAIDAVTAIASSGIAYFARLAEALAATAEQQGFSHSEAMALATHTLIGAGALAEDVELDQIRLQVATKGGTTEQALRVFDEENLNDLVKKAVEAAISKARQLRDS